jgi:tetratricopeptide (TPR) repeat protein
VPRVFLILVAAVLAITSLPAHADDRSEARDHFVKGTKAFELGAFDEAIAEYAAAYRIKDDPALLYNLGQAHRAANHPAEALRFYRLFLLKVPDTSLRDEVETKITELQKLIDQQKRAQSVPPDQPRPLGSTESTRVKPLAPATSPDAAPDATPAVVAAPATRADKPVYKRWWLWTTVAVAVVGVGVGVGLGVGLQPSTPKATTDLGTIRW